jgi:type III secretion system YscQ/HrcQ family protein
MPSVRPFSFSNLPRYSSEQVAVQQSLATYFTTRPFQPTFLTHLGGMLETYLKVPCSFSDVQLQPVSRGNLSAMLPATGCIIVVGVAPGEHKILVELDTGLAALAIDRLLGGSGDTSRIQRPLTEIEEGVLSFVILKVLGFTHEGWQTGKEMGLSLDRFAARVADVQQTIDSESGYYLLGLSLSAGKRVGYVRILLPNSLITQRFAAPQAQARGTGRELEHMRALFSSLGEREVIGRVEAATLDLGPEDIEALETGDIVILENHQLSLTPEGVTGMAFVRLGRGQNGGLRGQIVNDSERSRLAIAEIVVQEEPAETDMSTNEQPEGEDNLPETEGLLRDVPAPVVVELGRIRMNTSQVIRLRQGQILRLPRGPNDPVDLVVNGKLFARGELIEVDGELGVRLLQVVGAS